MSLKVSLSTEVSESKSFPKLMIGDQLIVFFIKSGIGIIITPEESINYVGEYSEDFQMAFFQDYNGEVTLKNE